MTTTKARRKEPPGSSKGARPDNGEYQALLERIDEIMGDGSVPFLERIKLVSKLIPESELEKLPKDFAANLDHYMYGAPKQS